MYIPHLQNIKSAFSVNILNGKTEKDVVAVANGITKGCKNMYEWQ